MSASRSISVVVPSYNVAPWIAATLRSVYAQGWPELEVVVVDDGSGDGSAELVARAFPQARLIRQSNSGAAAARNAGIEAAQGHWVAFLDGDDLWLPGKLQAQMQALASCPGAALACASWVPWHSVAAEPQAQELALLLADGGNPARWDGPSGWIYPEMLTACRVWTSTVVMQRALLRELGGFDPALKIGEDYDLWLRATRCTPVVRVRRPLALYRQRPASLTRQPPAMNYEGAVLERALQRWGLAAPDGRQADRAAVRRSLARTWHDFGAANLAAGHARRGLQGAGAALRADWRHLGAWKLAVKSVARAAWPR